MIELGAPGDPGVPRRRLPAGRGDTFCPAAQAADGRLSGRLQFAGASLQIEVDNDGEVLYPTDVGISLLVALGDGAATTFRGVRALDVGCGSGLYTVALLSGGAAHVVALDVNERCLAATVENVRRNGFDADRVKAVHTDIAGLTVDSPWDVVMCNPSHLPGNSKGMASGGVGVALLGGPDGRVMYDDLTGRLDGLLAQAGRLYLAHSSLADPARTAREVSASGFACRTLMTFEMDIPLREYGSQRAEILARLYRLRESGRSEFVGLRFEVHAMEVTRPVSSTGEESR